jgi:ADP-ribose pyrophosphatase YjhB (NUDIX family)
VRTRLRAAVYQTFYRLPGRWRRRIVRLFKPTFTVGAVVLAHDADAGEPGRLLLVLQPPGNGWSIPGGLLDRGERPAESAARELAEETGVRVAPQQLEPANPNAIVHLNGNWIDLVFHARVPATETITIDGAEVLEAAWHPVDNLPPLTVPTARLLARYGIGPYTEYPEVMDR